MAFASSAKGLSESGTGASAHLFRSEEASTPPERVTREPYGKRGRKIIERTSMGGLEPPTPAFGEVPNTAMGDFPGEYTMTLADTA